MKNDKEKVKKLFNLLKDGMDLLTNDQHRGVEINISSEPISYFSILDKNDEREANIFVNTTPKEVIDKTLRTFNTLGRDAKTLENLDYGEEFESYKNAGKKMWDYPALDQYELIESAKPLKALEDLDFNLDFDEYNIKIDSLRNKDYDNSRWYIFIKEGNQILDVNDINKIGIDNVAKLFTDKESGLEVIKEFGRELKPIENLKVLEDREQNSFYDPEKSYNGGGYHQPYQKLTFDIDGENYTLIYDNTSCGDFGKRYEIDLFITEPKKPVYHFEFNNIDKLDEDEDDYLVAFKEVLTKDLWNSLIYNEEINHYFEKDKTYNELFDEPEFGAPVYLLPMYNNTEDYYSDIIENNLFHFKKVHEKESDCTISSLLINNEEFDDNTTKENLIGALKDNNEVVLVKIEDFKDGILLVDLAKEEDINFNKPFLEFQTENNQIKDIRYFENIRKVTENTINELSFFYKDEFKDLPEVLELGKTNAEFLLGRDFLNDLKDELGTELYYNNDSPFISIENMNNILNKVMEETEIPAISEEKIEKIKEDFVKKIEEQKTINEDGYKGYDLDSLKLNFRISDEVGLKYRSVDEFQKEKEISKNEKNEKEKKDDKEVEFH